MVVWLRSFGAVESGFVSIPSNNIHVPAAHSRVCGAPPKGLPKAEGKCGRVSQTVLILEVVRTTPLERGRGNVLDIRWQRGCVPVDSNVRLGLVQRRLHGLKVQECSLKEKLA